MQVEWANKEVSWGGGVLHGIVGKYTWFTISYDASQPRDATKKYNLICKLPGIKNDLGYFESPEEAKTTAENVIRYWLNNSELEFKESLNETT